MKTRMNKSIFILFTGLGEAIAMAPLRGAKKYVKNHLLEKSVQKTCYNFYRRSHPLWGAKEQLGLKGRGSPFPNRGLIRLFYSNTDFID